MRRVVDQPEGLSAALSLIDLINNKDEYAARVLALQTLVDEANAAADRELAGEEIAAVRGRAKADRRQAEVVLIQAQEKAQALVDGAKADLESQRRAIQAERVATEQARLELVRHLEAKQAALETRERELQQAVDAAREAKRAGEEMYERAAKTQAEYEALLAKMRAVVA